MNELLGITEIAEKIIEKKQRVQRGVLDDLPEELIQEFRTLQGVILYLKAPKLFTSYICHWEECKQPFMVTRRHIVYCSWECMRNGIQSYGFDWEKGAGIEFDEAKMLALIEDRGLFAGQEPIWIRDLDILKVALQKLIDTVESKSIPEQIQETATS